MSGLEMVGVVLAIPALIELCRHTLVAIQDVRTVFNHARLAGCLLLPKCKDVPKQVSAIICQIERHLGSMDKLFDQDQGYLLDPLVQESIREFQMCANHCLY